MVDSTLTLEDQLNSNNFAGAMVILLLFIIIFMVIDRIIYTTYNSIDLKEIATQIDSKSTLSV
jgi:hypothetical protein